MRHMKSLATSAAASVLLAGCAGTSPTVSPPQAGGAFLQQAAARDVLRSTSAGLPMRRANGRRVTGNSWMAQVDAGRPLTYISDFMANNITVLDRAAHLMGQITGLSSPQGLFVDSNRNVWVANTNANDVLEFPRRTTSPSVTLNDPGEFPVDVTVCPNGTVFVSNRSATSGGTGSIAVYPSGDTSPTASLSYPGQGYNFFVTCDRSGNVLTTLNLDANNPPYGPAGVVEYPAGVQSGVTLLPISLGFPGGIKPDNAGNLLVNDQLARTVTEYTEAGVPTGQAMTYGDSTNDWIDIAVTQNSRVVAGADGLLLQGTALQFPSGRPRQVYHTLLGPGGSEPSGIAFDPGQTGI